jgi:CHASE1-domain containing sensor protein
MTAQDWAALAVAIVTILGSLAATVRWMVKNYLQELRPNSGSSLRDSVDRLEKRVDDIIRILLEK